MVRIEAETVRGYWLTDAGQRVTGWVPPGDYTRGPAVVSRGAAVVALVGADGRAWHVAASAVGSIDGDTVKPAGRPYRRVGSIGPAFEVTPG